MNITMIGAGYVGLVSGMCLGSLGNQVAIYDTDEFLIAKLRKHMLPILEEGLDRIAALNRASERVHFHHDCGEALRDAELVFLCVGTPTGETGEADLSALYAAVASIAPHVPEGATLVLKSTVPVGTNRAATQLLGELRPGAKITVASNPEFLREGSAVEDFLRPDRVVLGVRDERSRGRLLELYSGIESSHSKLIVTTPENAELAKYAANAFLAMKVTFINEIAELCERLGADVEDVAEIIGADHRIGPNFLRAGPGYGGSCFPKDTLALAAAATRAGAPLRLVETTIQVNESRKRTIAERILARFEREPAASRVGVLGVTFKAHTDDVRESPAIAVVRALRTAGVTVAIHDPAGRERAAKLLPDVQWCDHPIEVSEGADALVLLTEWPVYRELDFTRVAASMRGRWVFDTRNALPAEKIVAAGLQYRGVGRGAGGSPPKAEVLSPELRSLSLVRQL